MSVGKTGPVRSAFLGALLAIDAVGHCVALASFCFAGALTAGLGLATEAMLLSTAVATLALFMFSGLRNVVGVAQDTSIALLAPAIAMATTGMVGADDEARIATGLAVMGASALLSGVVFWLVGRFGLGRMVRLFPYPVSAGFLAGSGALLVMAGLFVVTGTDGWLALWAALGQQHILIGFLAALGFAATLVAVQYRFSSSTGILMVVAAALSCFYGVLAATGTDVETARALGFLPQTSAQFGPQIQADFSLFAQVDWMAVLWVAPSLAAVALLSMLGLLLNTAGVELATRSSVDVNSELRVAGAANVFIGLLGGLTSFLQAGASIFASKMNTAGRPMVLGYLAALCLAFVFAREIVAAVPVFIASGLLVFIGVTMLNDWLLATRKTMMPSDWRLIVVIVLLTVILGILQAIVAGLALAVLAFAIGYARLQVIRSQTDARNLPSPVDRSPEEEAILARDGHRIRILHLQGALFFGSMDQMALDIGKITAEDAQVTDIILDFGAVDFVDSAACAGLTKLVQTLEIQHIALHLSRLAPMFVAVIDRWGLSRTADQTAPLAVLRLWPDLDTALEACEERLLDQTLGEERAPDLQRLLANLSDNDPRTDDLLAILEPQSLVLGQVLIAAGSQTQDVYLLERGRLGVHLPIAPAPGPRVRVLAPGSLVGEMAQFLNRPRTADVIAMTDAKVWRMPAGLTKRDPQLALLWTTILARALALKVSQANRLARQNRTGDDD